MRLLINLGATRENIVMLDRKGVIYNGRDGINEYKAEFALDTDMRTLEDAYFALIPKGLGFSAVCCRIKNNKKIIK